MKHKFNKENLVIWTIIIITAIISFCIGNAIGISSRLVFMLLIAIELGIYVLIKKATSKNDNLNRPIEHNENKVIKENNTEIETYHNPMQERFDKVCAYTVRLEIVNYDTYELYFPSYTKEEIQTWETEHQIILPQGYKDWMLLSAGFGDISGTQLYPLDVISQYPFPDYEEYYIIGTYIGDGSNIVIDKNGGFYELDHTYGLKSATFEDFIDRWVIEMLEDGFAEAGIKHFYNINNLFSSYDLFSGTGWDNIRRNLEVKCPEMSAEERNGIKKYLESFYKYCVDYGDKLAAKYKTPFLPDSADAQKEIKEYVRHCKEKYVDIDEKHVIELFSNVCWLTNR